MPSLSFSNLQNVDQQQLRNTALNVFNTILLESGQGMNGTELTNDWGSITPWNSSSVKKFGLASSDESEFFTLDPDKVQRLGSSILGNISITQLKELLGLEEYGLCMRIIPPFNVTNIDGSLLSDNSPISIDGNVLHYAVKVAYLDGRPIPNAQVWAKAVYSGNQLGFGMTNATTYTTNSLGVFEGSAVLEDEPSFVTIILRITVADVATLVVTTGDDSIKSVDVGVVGDNVTLRIDPPAEDQHGSTPTTWVNEIYVVGGSDDVWTLYNSSGGDMFNPGEGNFEFWSKSFTRLNYEDPILLILNLNTVPKDVDVDGGRQDVVVAGPYQRLLGYSVFEFGDSDSGSHATIRIQRNVVIAGMTYTAELLIWRK